MRAMRTKLAAGSTTPDVPTVNNTVHYSELLEDAVHGKRYFAEPADVRPQHRTALGTSWNFRSREIQPLVIERRAVTGLARAAGLHQSSVHVNDVVRAQPVRAGNRRSACKERNAPPSTRSRAAKAR